MKNENEKPPFPFHPSSNQCLITECEHETNS